MTLRATDDRSFGAREAHRAAVVVTLLVFLWGACSLVIVPWDPFWIPNLSQTIISALSLLYLGVTWTRPQRRISDALTAAWLIYTLVLLPWTAITWCELGRPMEAFVVPQLGIITTALVVRGPWPVIIGTTALFVLESMFPYVYARDIGLADQLPVNEPLATLGIAAVGAGLLVLRRHRQQQAAQHVRLQSELKAIARMRPVIAHTIAELEEQLHMLRADIPLSDRGSVYSRNVGRALDRLGRLRGQLTTLAYSGPCPVTIDKTEERYLDRDAQFGAMVLVSLTAAISAGTTLWTYTWFGAELAALCAIKVVVDLGLLLVLVLTSARPSSRRAVWVIVIDLVTMLPVVDYGQLNLAALGRPYVALYSLKLLMCILGLTLTTRFRLGFALIGLTAANAVAVWFALDLGGHRDSISASEPYGTLIFMLIGLISLRMLEQRKLASLRLLRDQATASAAQRSADILFALHDRLNSPLQTLALAATAVTRNLPGPSSERVQHAIDRLVELSRELGNVEVPAPQGHPLRDADEELRLHA